MANNSTPFQLLLAGIADTRVNKAGANTLVFQLAHEPFKVPGDAGFALGGLLTTPVDKQEEGNQSTAGVVRHAG